MSITARIGVPAVAAALALVAASAVASPQGKVDVCHPSGNSGNVLTLNVNGNAVDAHLDHGDWLPETFYADADGDGFGDADGATVACLQPEGTVDNGDDCDDSDGGSFPGADEVCDDGADNDCDGEIDEDCAIGCVAIRLHCNSGSSIMETVCGAGVHTLAPSTASNISYVTFLDADVSGVVLHHCDGTRTWTTTNDLNLCSLPGGCCGAGRWNDEVCAVELF